MRYLHRELESRVTAAARSFPGIVLTGPRGLEQTARKEEARGEGNRASSHAGGLGIAGGG